MQHGPLRTGTAATVLAAVLWGSSFPVTKLGLPSFGDPLCFAAVRLSVATVIAIALLRLLGRLDWGIYRSPYIWLLGLTNGLGIALQNYGLMLTTASKTALLVDINVVVVAILSFWLFKERFGRMKVGGVLVGIIGVVLLTYSPDIGIRHEQLLGDALVFLSGVSYAVFIVTMKKVVASHSPLEASVAAISVSALLLAIPTLLLSAAGTIDTRMDPSGLAPLLYLAVLCTTLAYYLWAFGLRAISATISATILLLEVVSALLISFAMLGESLTPLMATGATLIIIAIVLVSRERSNGRREEAVVPKNWGQRS